MKKTCLAVVLISLAAAISPSRAATYNQTFYNSTNNELWNNPVVWGNNAVTAGNSYSTVAGQPSATVSYAVNGTTWSWRGAVRDTHGDAPASTTFLGDSLILNAETRLIMKGYNDAVSTANIVLNGGHIILAANSGGAGTAGTATLAGTLDVAAPLAAIGVYGVNTTQSTLNINSTITGSGTLQLTSYGTTRVGTLNVTGDYSAFAGTFYVANATDQNPASGTFSFAAGSAPLATLDMSTTSSTFFFNLNSDISFGTVIIDGTTLAAGTYAFAELDAIAPGKFLDNLGTVTVVPEPSPLALMAGAVLAWGFGWARRRGGWPSAAA